MPKSMHELAAAIGAVIGYRLQPEPAARVHGGSINEAYRWEGAAGPLFVKVATADRHAMFAAEAAGLEELRRANALRIPRVLGVGVDGTNTWLALEWLSFGPTSRLAEHRLGERLALQHRYLGRTFGWDRDNTIGTTPQLNGWMPGWVEFFRERRLRYQLELACRDRQGGSLRRTGETLLERLDGFFAGYQPLPSLLHGDLWSGNQACDASGQPVIFDPAVYYGDREADLAMTRLFGGFGTGFYAAYESAWPLDPGARSRVALYNLYHVLNHAKLFGGGYMSQAAAMIAGLLAELRS